MALIDPTVTKKIDLPHEEGAWVEVRPITARAYATVQHEAKAKDDSASEVVLRFLASSIVDWSYDVPVTPENIDRLDVDTLDFLDKEINLTSGFLSASEKKDSGSPSSPTSDQAGDSSPPNSDT